MSCLKNLFWKVDYSDCIYMPERNYFLWITEGFCFVTKAAEIIYSSKFQFLQFY